MEGFKTYKLQGTYKGISDLKSIYAFHGNSQGDDSVTNDVEDYKNSAGWMSVSEGFKNTDIHSQTAVDERSSEIEEENKLYIEYLHKIGEYGKYNGDFLLTIKENPMHDAPLLKGKGVESYKMTLINLTENESIQEKG
jgi:hypothetical protein